VNAFLEIPLASALFLLLFAASIVEYARDRSRLAGVVVLIFGAVSPLFAVRLLNVFFDFTLPQPLQLLSIAGVLAQPLLTLWLASLLERVPRWVVVAAAVGFLLTAPPVVLLLPAPSLPLLVAAVGVYAATALTAAAYFLRAAKRRTGSARLRLAVASGATVLIAATLLILVVAAAVPGTSELASVAARYGVLLAAIGYALAFLTPGWLRRLWGARTAYQLSRRLLTSSPESDESITWRTYLDLVAGSAGVRHGAMVVGTRGRGATTVAAMGEMADRQTEWLPDEFDRLLANASDTHQQSSVKADFPVERFVKAGETRFLSLVPFVLPQQKLALLILADERRSLFTHDDNEIFETLGLEAAVLADRARASAEQIALRERLMGTVEALRAAHRAKSDFLASMSHELRTPLNAILGFSDLMRSEPESDGRRLVPEQWIEHVHVAGRHLLELINDVLDLAKVEAGRLDLRPEAVRVESAVAESIAGLRPLIEQKRLAVTSAIDMPPITVDRSRLRQVLYNLLSNAIKYTPEDGAISVEGQVMDGETHISVSDTGVGIAPEDHERVFEEFIQVGEPDSRLGGTGLGLALTRRLVEAHGGRMELRSAPGTGSRFTVILPMVPGVPDEMATAAPAPRPAAAAQAQTAPGAPRVLVIEDDPQALVLLRSYMEPSGYRVVAAGDGEAGVRAARLERPAAILLDVLLPGTDGWEVLRRLKADAELRGIPVLMITVVDEREVGLALGAVDYLVKPIERSTLLAALARHVPAVSSGRLARALAVDDDPATLSMVAAVLKDQNCEVLLAEGGRQALEMAANGPLDLVVCDLVMPDLDGFEVVARLKASPATRDVPILILTGHELTDGDKARLNGKIVGICEKGEEGPARLREWLAHVTTGAPTGPR